ncbi:uncharacterized protein LOC123292014 [Chrysoperla carnea]|uniref:uncharacterized protein LOC123292014 n=1 Tax=Chrysoperla carnea TaxID=189513 RepID=UPI001D07D00B|nr:uncharacterized protein LOC123292014 [Chrysoperla carnea]
MGCIKSKAACKDSQGKKAGNWIAASKGEVPKKAMIGGYLSNDNLYVVRAKRGGARLISGYLRPKDKAATIAAGLTYKIEDYEVLCNAKAKWKSINLKSEEIPSKAIYGGIEPNNQDNKTYIGRVQRGNDCIIGNLDPYLKRIFIPYQDREEEFASGDVLVMKNENVHFSINIKLTIKNIYIKLINARMQSLTKYVYKNYTY